MPSISWFLATVFTQNDSITLSFSSVTVTPYFRLTMFGIIDMTCPAALPLVYLSYTDCDLTMPSIPWALATVFTQDDSFTLSFSSVTVLPYFRLSMFGIIDMTCPAALLLVYLSYSDCDLTMHSIPWFLAPACLGLLPAPSDPKNSWGLTTQHFSRSTSDGWTIIVPPQHTDMGDSEHWAQLPAKTT